MNVLTQTTRVLLVAALSGGMFASVAQAQPSSSERPVAASQPTRGHHAEACEVGPRGGFAGHHRGPGAHGGGGGHRAGPMGQPGPQPLFGLLSARSAEAIDVAAVRLTHRLELSDEQGAALGALQQAALSAQAGLQLARDIARESRTQDGDRLIAGYAGLVAMTTARAEALASLQPALEAFVSGLTDEQRAKLTPQPPRPNSQPAAQRGNR